jgi:hypothetical protein
MNEELFRWNSSFCYAVKGDSHFVLKLQLGRAAKMTVTLNPINLNIDIISGFLYTCIVLLLANTRIIMIGITDRPMTKSSMEAVDQILFLKKGIAFWKHLIPFSVAALLLLVFSLPADNLLLKLVQLLEKPSWLWVPAIWLTLVALGVYLASMQVEVRKAYLWLDGALRRSILTAVLFILICGVVAFLVLSSAGSRAVSGGLVWACLLLSILSLTGIGWSGPDKWAESLGLTSPDYTQARIYATDLENFVNKTRKKSAGTAEDVKEFLAIVNDLKDELEKNRSLEPEWAVEGVETAIADVQELIRQTESSFPLARKEDVESFVDACNFKMDSLYPEFVAALKKVSSYWTDWKYSKGGHND